MNEIQKLLHNKSDLEVKGIYHTLMNKGDKEKASQIRAAFILKNYFETDVIGTVLEEFIHLEEGAINDLIYLSNEQRNSIINVGKEIPPTFSSINTLLLYSLFKGNRIPTRTSRLNYLRFKAKYELCSGKPSTFKVLFTYAIFDTICSEDKLVQDNMVEDLVKHGEQTVFFLNGFFSTFQKICNEANYPEFNSGPANVEQFYNHLDLWYTEHENIDFTPENEVNTLREATLMITVLYLLQGNSEKVLLLLRKALSITNEDNDLYWTIRFLEREFC